MTKFGLSVCLGRVRVSSLSLSLSLSLSSRVCVKRDVCACACVKEVYILSIHIHSKLSNFLSLFFSSSSNSREKKSAYTSRVLRCPSSPSPLFRDCGQHNFEKDAHHRYCPRPFFAVAYGVVVCLRFLFGFGGVVFFVRVFYLSSRWWCLDPPHKRRERERTLSRDTKSLSSSSSRFVERRDALLLLRQSVKKRERRATRRKRRHDGETRASLCMTN